MEKEQSVELQNQNPEIDEETEQTHTTFNPEDVKIIAEKQLTRMKFIAEVLSKAKKVNKHTEKNEIVNIDDILVEMAILQMKKMTEVFVFYIKISYQGKKWT